MEERSGFSQQYISGLEQGRRNPTVVTLMSWMKLWASRRLIYCKANPPPDLIVEEGRAEIEADVIRL